MPIVLVKEFLWYRFAFSNLTTFKICSSNEKTSAQNNSTSDNYFYLAFSKVTGFLMLCFHLLI
jgi:hypothetical protein